MSEITIRVMADDEGLCPECGAQGNAKVLNNAEGECGHWQYKCTTPSCTVGYFDPPCGYVERRPSREELAEIGARVSAEVDAMMEGREFVEVTPGTWKLMPVK